MGCIKFFLIEYQRIRENDNRNVFFIEEFLEKIILAILYTDEKASILIFF